MKVAVMQPYLFPYIGYFQLIKAVDKFIFYDDVHFIKKGWINRNNILINGQASLFTIPLKNVSQNKLINETEFYIDDKWLKQFETTLHINYKKAPYYNKVSEIILSTIELRKSEQYISDLAMESVKIVSNYLNLETSFEISSKSFPETKGMEKAERLKSICLISNAYEYINPSGGIELYDKADFLNSGIKLSFINSVPISYRQFDHKFVPWLSIIDILMFNDVEEINKMLNQYNLNY